MTIYDRLLSEITNIILKDATKTLSNVKWMLAHPVIRDELAKRPIRRALLAERFNVFSALGLDRRENYHSRFLAYLLDPQRDHDQGTFFLEHFLEHLQLKEPSSSFPQGAIVHEGVAKVVTEQFAGAHGRIDLVIHLANRIVIAIENKIDHSEGNRQLPRYRSWLNSLGPNGHLKLIFLTPTGIEPESARDRNDAAVDLCLGYFDLAEWLGKCISKLPTTASRLSTVLIQYQQLCRMVSGEPDMANIKDEIVNLIRQPENLKAALEIAKYLELEKKSIDVKFRENVVSALRKKLAAEGIKAWRASVDNRNGVFGIYHEFHYNQKSPNYVCGIEKLFNGGYYGWRRPQWIDPKDVPKADSSEISCKMLASGNREAEASWLGWNPLDDVFKRWDDDVILMIYEDNGKPIPPLAEGLADQIWKMFSTYYQDIEALPSFKQAASKVASSANTPVSDVDLGS